MLNNWMNVMELNESEMFDEALDFKISEVMVNQYSIHICFKFYENNDELFIVIRGNCIEV